MVIFIPPEGRLQTLRHKEQLQYVRRFVRFGAEIMAKKKASGDEKAMKSLQSVPGVGKSTAQKLVAGGIRTANQLAKASMKKLIAIGLTSATAKKLASAAAKSTAKTAVKTVKEAPKKAATKAKTIAMSAKTAAAKGTAKAKKAIPAKKKSPAKKAKVKKKDAKTVEVKSNVIPTPNWKDKIKKWKSD
ncbi:MAG: hypothetical protein CMB65_05455 [Euryarchaeota archaeon]|nr:hypothetical protein [Euryarchaeota archaeon]